MNINRYSTPQQTCIAIIERIIELQKSNKRVTIALSGGNTPKLLFKIIHSNYPNSIGSNVHFYWGDERMVPYESSESNYGEFYRELVESNIIKLDNVHPIPFNSNYNIASEQSNTLIKSGVEFVENRAVFNLIILGVGEDGHIASIFPNNLNSFISNKITEVVQHPQSGQTRVTLSGETINCAKEIIMLCTGSSKKEILKEIIEKNNPLLPASYIKPHNGKLEWYLDKAAAEW